MDSTAQPHPTRRIRVRALEREECLIPLAWIESGDALYQWSGPWHFRWPLDRDQLLRDFDSAGNGRRLYAAVDGEPERMVGYAMLTMRLDHGSAIIGRVLIAPDHRGRGIGTALMRELVRTGFDELGLHRLQLNVYSFNTVALACYQRVGFTIEGRQRDSTRGSDGYWTAYSMSLLEHEYRAQTDRGSASLRIRPAGFHDAAALADLLTELGYPHDGDAARSRLGAWAGDPAGTVLLAQSDGAPVGFIAGHIRPYIERPGACLRIVALSVAPGARRSGVGRQLVDAVEAWAAARQCTELEVTSSRTRDPAHAFYRALGFEDQCARSARFKRAVRSA